jgi:hypothetical protein
VNDVSDPVAQAKAALVEVLDSEIATLKKRIEEAQDRLDKLYTLLEDLVRQVHQITAREMEEHLGPVAERSQKAWKARNIALCRLFLTTNMTVRDIAKYFSMSNTNAGLILYRFGIPTDRSFTSGRSRQQREGRGFGERKEQLPPDLQQMIEALKAP